MFGLGYPEILMILGVGVLLFGKRLPEVGRSLGKGIVEFKKGLNGIEETLDVGNSTSSYSSSTYHSERANDALDVSVPKFDPPTSAPVVQASGVGGEPHTN